VDAYASADPAGMLDAIHEELTQAGMLRDGDEGRYTSLRSGIEKRLTELPAELELNRDAPYINYCGYPYELCGDTCVYLGECPVCDDPPEPDPGEIDPGASPDAGVDDPEEPGSEEPLPEEPLPEEPGGACRPPLEEYPLFPIIF
jgi:hypothetical protein